MHIWPNLLHMDSHFVCMERATKINIYISHNIHLYMYPAIYLSVSPCINRSIHVSIHVLIHPSMHWLINWSIHLSINPQSIHPTYMYRISAHVSTHRFIHPSILSSILPSPPVLIVAFLSSSSHLQTITWVEHTYKYTGTCTYTDTYKWLYQC